MGVDVLWFYVRKPERDVELLGDVLGVGVQVLQCLLIIEGLGLHLQSAIATTFIYKCSMKEYTSSKGCASHAALHCWPLTGDNPAELERGMQHSVRLGPLEVDMKHFGQDPAQTHLFRRLLLLY